MPLGFQGDAIKLSNETGTKLKTQIISNYYKQWWKITSGNRGSYFRNNTSIIEMHAATGEIYIESTDETLLGSAGHALELKLDSDQRLTRNLKIICIEENDDCYYHLKRVIKRRWPQVDIKKSEGDLEKNDSNIYLIHAGTEKALEVLDKIENQGNSIYFFDPLLNVEWNTLERVARKRIKSYHQTGTEFILFLFTSDWFTGREDYAGGDDFSALPRTEKENEWNEAERRTVEMGDSLFGHKVWRNFLLTEESLEIKKQLMVELYRISLFRWFRYVLPLPFEPKEGQLYHIFICSNYEAGISITKGFYQAGTPNPKYAPNNPKAYKNFKRRHPDVCRHVKHPRKPIEWKILWKIIKNHEFGMCDPLCRDFITEESDLQNRINALDWLEKQGYLKKLNSLNPYWEEHYQKYRLDWDVVTNNLKIDRPPRLIPLKPS